MTPNVEVSGTRGDDRTTGEAIDERLRSTKPPSYGAAALTCWATRRFGEQLASLAAGGGPRVIAAMPSARPATRSRRC